MILVDYSQISISTLMAELAGHTDVEINLPLVRHMIINAIRSYKVKFEKEYGQMIIACDSRYYWRKGVFPHYKAGRKKVREDSGFDWKSIFEALNQVKQELAEFFPYPVLEVDGAEADDIIATLVEWSQTNDCEPSIMNILDDAEPKPIMIISGDHDFQQLQKYPNVHQYSPVEKKTVVTKESPELILMEHILRGDKGDGVPNFLSPDDVFVSGGRQKPIRQTAVDEWKKHGLEGFTNGFATYCDPMYLRNFQRNRQLVDLSYIPKDVKEQIEKQFLLIKNQERDSSKILNYLMVHRMKNLIEYISEF